MTFLNPLILLGLIAAGVPLIIHLFNFRKPKKVDFSSLAFLREVERSTMQRVRIKQWLLLVLRTLAIAAMVIAFARPTLRGQLAGAFAGAAPVGVAVVVDTSPSMAQRDSRGAYIDQAMGLARGILADTDSRDEVAIVGLRGSGPASIGPGGEAALRRLDALSVSASSRTTLEALATAAEGMGRVASQNREVYFIGDLQASTLVDTSGMRIPDTSPVYLVPVGSGSPENVGVANVELRSRIVEADQPVQLVATLTNYGTTAAASYVTSVYLEGVRVAQSTTDLSPGAATTVEFSVSPTERGWLAGVVETEDDTFPDDNRAYFALRVPDQRQVLVVAGDGQDIRYLGAALRADPRISLSIRTVPEQDLASLDLSAYDAVILAAPRTLTSGEIDRVATYVGAGGGVLFFPSASARVEDYNGLLAAVGGGRVNSLPSGGDGTTVDAVDRVDLEHPLFSGVLDSSSGGLERPTIYQRMMYAPGAGAESSVMEMSSGAPFLQEIRHRRGSMLLMAVAPDPTWSDLPTRGLFIPLVYRSMFLLSASGTTTGDTFHVGDSGEVLLAGIDESAAILINSPSGLESAPLTRTGVGGTLVSLAGILDEAGLYRVLVNGETQRLVAVNNAPRESDLQLASPTEATAMLSQRSDAVITALEVGGAGPIADRVEDARRGADLWNVFLALALLFLAAEMVVARQWKPETAS